MKVVIFTIPGCPYSLAAKEFLKSEGFQYEEITVPVDKKDREILDQFAEIFPDDLRGVPVMVFEIGGERFVANDEKDPRLLDWLKKHGVI